MEPEKVEYVMKIKQDITSLDAGVGRDGDEGLYFIDFIEDEDSATPEESAASSFLKSKFNQFFQHCQISEQKIIKMRFGLENGKATPIE